MALDCRGAHHALKDEAEVLAVLEAAQHAHAVALAVGVRARQLAQDDHLRLPGLVHHVVGADHLCMHNDLRCSAIAEKKPQHLCVGSFSSHAVIHLSQLASVRGSMARDTRRAWSDWVCTDTSGHSHACCKDSAII